MSKLGIEQKTVKELLSDNKADFIIPDYQRPYAWGEKECQTLWEDIFTFAFPDNDCDKFDRHNDEYFLGPIVTFINENKKEIIDGQQRLTTLMLLLRAFYARYKNMQDEVSLTTRRNIEKCIWKTDEFDKPDMQALKIDSEVATDNDKDEFLEILRTGVAEECQKSVYAKNYRYFQARINKFLEEYPSYFAHLPTRILNNCILLPIEAESQDTALRIFSTLNDRGKPLSDSDIFKAQFYKYYTGIGEKKDFIEKWKQLEELCEKVYHPMTGTPMDEAFTRYMYYERAKQGIKSSTTEALRKFYEKDAYALLKKKETFENIIDLTEFWNDVELQSINRFSDRILRQLFVLNYAPNGMWTYFVSVYYLTKRDKDGFLDEDEFFDFLSKTIAFIWTYAVLNPGVNNLRTPIYAAMVNIINGEEIEFPKFNIQNVTNVFNNFMFSNNRAITKAMLTWWAFSDDEQELMSLESALEIEHIFARKRQENENSLSNPQNLEALGNKALLEKRINIRASDYKFSDKKKYYLGFENSRNQKREGTKIKELRDMATTRQDFDERDIVQRTADILFKFTSYLRENDLIE